MSLAAPRPWVDRLDAVTRHLPTAPEWLLSAKTFAAALLSFYLALSVGLPRPYWAFATAYVVSNALTGATRSKGVYRMLGTLIGAGAAVLVLPVLVDTPVLLSLFVSVWTGTLLYLSFLDRLPSNYVYMLSAYSLPMIALAMVQTPEQVFPFAVARSEEILLGILCAGLVSSLVLPGKAGPVLQARFQTWLADASTWATGLLRSEAAGTPRDAATQVSSHRLAGDVLALDQFINHLRYDTDSADVVRMARELRMRLGLLLPTLSSLSTAVRALRESPHGVPPDLAARMDEIADWVAAPASIEGALHGARLQQQLRELALRSRAANGADDLLHRHVLKRLEGLVQLWRDGQSLQRMMANGRLDPDWTPAYERWTFSPSVRHHDRGMQLFSAASASAVTFLACLVWIWSGWSDGASMVIMCAVVSCFFAAQDEPAPAQFGFVVANTLCLVMGLALLFLVLPAAHEFETLALALAPIFLLLGTLVARPAFAVIALGLTVTLASNLALSDSYSADFGSFVNSGLAAIAGNLLAFLWTLLTRPFGASLSLHRLLQATWRDLARTAAGRHRGDVRDLRARMIDRLSQLMPRLAGSTGLHCTDGLPELRVGLSAVLLQQHRAALPAEVQARVQAALDAVALHYRRRLQTPGAPAAGAVLRGRIDRAVESLTPLASRSDAAHDVLHALIELRLTLLTPAPEASS